MRRILFCTLEYHPGVAGGAEHQARLQAEEFVRRGYSVTIVCPRSAALTSGLVDGVFVRRLPRLGRGRYGTLTYYAALSAYLLLTLRGFAVVHVHLANLQADLAVFIARILRRPAYVKVAAGGARGDVHRLQSLRRWWGAIGLRRANAVQALSAEIERELLTAGVEPHRIARIPNGLRVSDPQDRLDHVAARRMLGLPADAVIFLFAGRFARYKGLADLLAAWRPARGRLLLLIGEEALDEPFGALPQSESIVVRPWARDLRAYHAACDVFVLPSHQEGMSNALLEAMQAGMAVLVTRVGAAEEMVVHGESGILVPPHDTSELHAGIELLASDQALRSRLGLGAASAAHDFSIANVVDRIEATYRTHCGLS